MTPVTYHYQYRKTIAKAYFRSVCIVLGALYSTLNLQDNR
jgi:hypothetical protein